ncbi:SMI1/KNR4 family protein [Streptomyces sp. N2-109]|uniref:SMI1/KNR4 family protein n=1 Tax=Streptomyces gossypii TaxID=2883101 RepID=A0ABT2JMI8_9ACTN|nr:SMI1/KNR4 family protein [Streptomyces gossypii]
MVIPPDLRAFYRLHDGTGPAAGFDWPTHGVPLPTREEQWGGYLLPDGGIGPLGKMRYWSEYQRGENPQGRYLPFIVTDPDGLYGLFADCAPGEGYGQVGTYAEAFEHVPGVWPSFAAYLTQVADAL